MTQYPNLETHISQFTFLAHQDVEILKMLYNDSRVDKISYLDKLQQVHDNLKSIENSKDLVTGLKAASEFLSMANLVIVKFGENPDFHVQTLNHDFAIEVKNFRYRSEDSHDETSLSQAGHRGELVIYGNSAEVQIQIEEAIAKKVLNYQGTDTLFLYFWSHSPHQVEDVEIECAARTILYDDRYSKLAGLFYKFSNRTVLVYPARNQNRHVEIFEDSFFLKSL